MKMFISAGIALLLKLKNHDSRGLFSASTVCDRLRSVWHRSCFQLGRLACWEVATALRCSLLSPSMFPCE